MKYFKCIICLFLIFTMLLVCNNSAIYAYDFYNQKVISKVSPELSEKINIASNDETFNVEIMFDASEIYKLSSDLYNDFIENSDSHKSLEDVHLFRERLINSVKEKCIELNSAYIKTLNNDVSLKYFSELAPYIIVEISTKELKKLILNNSYIDKIDLFTNDYESNSLDKSVDAIRGRTIQENDVFGYTGQGVRVGIIEGSGYPDTSVETLQNASIIKYINGTVSEHPSYIAEVIVSQGSDNVGVGVAPEATLYCASTMNCQIDECLNWLIGECQVDVINLSMNSLSLSFNTYGLDSAIIDYYSQNFLTTIVVASGNNGNLGVQGFGMSYNAITVGNLFINSSSSVADDYLHRTSSYNNSLIPTNGASKPDIVAPGSSIYLYDDYRSGTSIAAPHVTGAIALIGEQEPLALVSPASIKAIITAGVYNNSFCFVPSDRELSTSATYGGMGSSYVQYGSGILNCVRNAYIVAQGNYDFTYIDATDEYDDFLISCSANKKVRVSLAFENNVKKTIVDDLGYYNFSEQLNNLDLRIYDSSMNEIASSVTTYNNVEIAEFVPTSSGIYKIRIERGNLDNCTRVRYGYAWIQG